jgi:hypothetical protein
MKEQSKKPAGKGKPAKAPKMGDDVKAKPGKAMPFFEKKGKAKK